jgi:1-acyl-sn-glycerol-3-phosphate acyltransferase
MNGLTLAGSRHAWAAFEVPFAPWMRRRLRGPFILGDSGHFRLPAGPVLMIANHVSWWDGFLLREAQRLIRPDAPFSVVMAADQLRRHRYLRWLGAIPLEAGPMGPRRLLRSLQRRCVRTPDLMIGFFPQGRIWPSWRRPLGFAPGAAWLASRLSPITVLPVGLHVEALNQLAPAAFISLGAPMPSDIPAERMEAEVGAAVGRIHEHLDQYGEGTPDLWNGR